jgi:hypothetical protein
VWGDHSHHPTWSRDARILPETYLRQAEVDRAIANVKALQRRTGKITVDELCLG